MSPPKMSVKVDNTVRQFGFPEMDLVSVTKSITKYSVAISDIKNLRYELEKAHFISQGTKKRSRSLWRYFPEQFTPI